MIQVLVSDLGNVLLPVDMDKAFSRLAAAGDRGEERGRQVARIYTESGFSRGVIGPQAFYQRVVDAIGLRLEYAEFCRAWSDIFTEDAAVLEMVRNARVQRRYLLSNTDPIHWAWIHAHHAAVLAPFDRLFASHECGMEKPDPEIFRMVIRHSGMPPEAHLFIDDLPPYVEAARSVGMDAVVHQGAEHLRVELRRRNILAADTSH